MSQASIFSESKIDKRASKQVKKLGILVPNIQVSCPRIREGNEELSLMSPNSR